MASIPVVTLLLPCRPRNPAPATTMKPATKIAAGAFCSVVVYPVRSLCRSPSQTHLLKIPLLNMYGYGNRLWYHVTDAIIIISIRQCVQRAATSISCTLLCLRRSASCSASTFHCHAMGSHPPSPSVLPLAARRSRRASLHHQARYHDLGDHR